MKKLIGLLAIFLAINSCWTLNPHGADIEDNDFAEFEEFDDEEFVREAAEEEDGRAAFVAGSDDIADDDEVMVEDEEDEFEHFNDDEEFEPLDQGRPMKNKGPEKPPDLKINKIPYHLRTNWDSFYLEMLMLAGLAVYFLNFLAGKSKNHRLAQAWLTAHKELLEANFSIVGDDGETKEVQSGILMKESENIYNLWCSGRLCCEGMLVTLKLLKRQDLVSTIARFFKPASDQIIIKVNLDEAEMDSFIFFLANKKVCAKIHKEMNDLSLYCGDRKNGEKFGVPKSFQLLVEPAEITNQILDNKVMAALNKYEGMVESMHFSDQYSGPRQQDQDQPTKAPEMQKVLLFAFNVPGKGAATVHDMESMEPLMKMVFYCMDKIKRIRLSREAKNKVTRRRQQVEDQYQKATHQQRADAAQLRREEKKRAEKERMMADDADPDKQRKWEERENRRDLKKKQAKAKMMKVKAM